MSWWDRLLGREGRSLENPNVSLTSERAFYEVFGGGGLSSAGVNINASKALTVPAVASATDFIAGTFASMPLQVFKKTDNGRETADSDPLYSIVHDVVNDDNLTSFAWRKQEMMKVLVFGGRSLTFIERNRAGRVMNLWPLDPAAITVVKVDGYRYYRGKVNGKQVEYTSDEIIDVPFMMEPDGITSIDPVAKFKNAFGLCIALEEYAARFFQNGGVPPLAMTGPAMSDVAAQRASSDVQNALKRAKSEQRNVMVVPNPYELKPIGVSPEDSQLVEARRAQNLEVARVYHLPPAFIQDLQFGTFSNTEQQDLQFVKHTMTQHLAAWESEMNAKLFGVRNRKSYVEFNVDGLLRGDFKTRFESYRTGIQGAFLTPNEARAMENRDDMDGGDRLYVQGATVPLEMAGQLQTPPLADGAQNAA